MTLRLARPLLAALCLAACTTGATAADLIPTADFARHAPLTNPLLSPDGQHVSVAYHDPDGKTHGLAIFSISDMTKPITLIRMPPYEMPADIMWTSNTRLVVARGKVDGSIGRETTTGELMAVDIDGKKPDYLYGFEAVGKRVATRALDRGWGFIDGKPPVANGHFYMRSVSWEDQDRSTLYDVDAQTSARRQMADIGIGYMVFMVDPQGVPRFTYGVNNEHKWVVFRRDANGGWAKVEMDREHQRFSPIAQVAGSTRIYAEYSPDGVGGALVEQDDTGGNVRVIRKDSFSQVSSTGLWTAQPYRPFATRAETGLPTVTYVDPQDPTAKLHMAISQKFPGYALDFNSFSEDGSELMFSIWSDRDPGRVMLINTKTYKVTPLFTLAPWIDPSKMAERRSLHFKARDGEELEAILTFPKGKPESKLPMVLMPHGGPFEEKDTWAYDETSQFLASRGYLVLQVNFRGSDGRGKHFITSGYHEWGGLLQNDLIDGVKWAIGQNFADASRVCVFGGSFGGYSAMMAPIREPGMFKCAVGYAGIYDLPMMYEKGDIQQNKRLKSELEMTLGTDPAMLVANSPDRMADKLNLPIMLVHGEDDERAPFAQFKAMKAALDAAHKPYETLTKPDEKHGFVKPANVEELFDKLAAFLDRNIGDGASSKSAAP
ncbi:S9 family peptidase [Luteibacter pinisoli]|uniref:S9 family peptidase n=1 Tax=Luteibacter pinisoli TaxID=2589080 RepID=A0A4Y5Z8J2_9GAMM|nr:prolyl oligopeptidase family serine peptidase [Luteibacter pinisoli]QDE40463.1 S9 family peptidase [Luteibacter pinisoli]